MKSSKLFLAEALGTFILMLGGPGTAVLVPGFEGKVLLVALAFGLSLLVAAYAIGPVSGCHINPAITIGMVAAKKLQPALAPIYIVGQITGAALGGLAIWGIANGGPGDFDASPSNFAVNGWANLSPAGFNFSAMLIVELVLTAILMYVVLSTTHAKFSAGFGGLTAGMTLALIHMISIPVDNTSVNPARSFGVAIFAGGDAMEQLWAFIVFPIIGAIIGTVVYRVIND
jgi:aquaporin Z